MCLNKFLTNISNMSVQLKAFAKAIDLSKIRSYLFGSDDTKGSIHIIMIIYRKKNFV